MSITVTATKSVSFKQPYTGKTFQTLTDKLLGRDGYISGGAATDNGATISLGPTVFAQRGIIVEAAAVTGLTVPGASQPWFVVASVLDDHPDSGAQFMVTADLGVAAAGLVVAFKMDGIWRNPPSVDIGAAAHRSSEKGIDQDVEVIPVIDDITNLVTDLNIFRGSVVDADGERRELPAVSPTVNAGLAKTLTTLNAHGARYRTDHVVLRKLESHTPEIVLALGQTAALEAEQTGLTAAIVATPGSPTAAGYYAKRGGTLADQWWASADGADIEIQRGGGFFGTPSTLLTGGSNILETWIAGQRASDSALILLYVEGQLLKLVSFHQTTLAQVNASVTIGNTAAQISRVRGVLDRNETLHVVFENDEATQQIYYGTFSIASGTFGNAGVVPAYLAGAVTATNDTWPSIGVDRLGNATIAHTQGSGTNDYGNVVISTIGPSAELVSQKVLAPATDAAVDARPRFAYSWEEPEPAGKGFAPTVFTSFRRPSVAITPHGDAYVAMLGHMNGRAASTHVMLFHKDFESLHGNAVLNAFPEPTTTETLTAVAMASGELGELVIVFKEARAANEVFYRSAVLHPSPFRTGREDSLSLYTEIIEISPDASAFTDLRLAPGPHGNFQANMVLAADIATVDVYTARDNQLRSDPRDIVLSSMVVPPGGGATQPDASSAGFEVFNTRPKRMNYPFLVGKDGDYHGFRALYDALKIGNRTKSEVVVRSGHYVLREEPLWVRTRLRGEGNSVLVSSGDGGGIVLGGVGSSGEFTAAVSGNTAIISSTTSSLLLVRPGDIIAADPYTADNQHVVLRNLGYNATTARYRVLVSVNANGGLAASGDYVAWASGAALEDLSIIGDHATNRAIGTSWTHRAVFRNLTMAGNVSLYFTTSNYAPLVDSVDMSKITIGATDVALRVGNPDGTLPLRNAIIRDVRLTGGHGQILVDWSCVSPTLINCGSATPDPGGNPIFLIYALGSEPVYMLGCLGKISDQFNRTRTIINPRLVIENTNGHKDQVLSEWIGDEHQIAPFATFTGKMGAGLGAQMRIDATGEISSTGRWYETDFYNSVDDLWITGKGGVGVISNSVGIDVVRLNCQLGPGPSFASFGTRISMIGDWSEKPLLRVLAGFARPSETVMYAQIGLATEPGWPVFFGTGENNAPYFLLDPGNSLGFGGSTQLRFVVFNNSGTPTSVLTGFTPVADALYWLWIGYKSGTEAYWGISNTTSPEEMLASGSLAVGSGSMQGGPLHIRMNLSMTGPLPSGDDVELYIDKVKLRTSTRPSSI